jgi:hypothetical protein
MAAKASEWRGPGMPALHLQRFSSAEIAAQPMISAD